MIGLINYVLVSLQGEIPDEDKKLISCVDYYFVQDDGGRFKVCDMNFFKQSLDATTF